MKYRARYFIYRPPLVVRRPPSRHHRWQPCRRDLCHAILRRGRRQEVPCRLVQSPHCRPHAGLARALRGDLDALRVPPTSCRLGDSMSTCPASRMMSRSYRTRGTRAAATAHPRQAAAEPAAEAVSHYPR
ncbi:hypothetical protein PVAP13_2KG443505 [Panicum virgatum]|uniref:Uncharacterized protein n=1 Tax=Panicum virgatum TaxID=38727 RepID=A0A8T0WHX8_PANVG|nr:hypothetical protein PVAP13_2KG443505 [Panicum virgatum]KAG2645446.1 hypothetical protein PVAP13_2KG443505 [Panicum virgatum]